MNPLAGIGGAFEVFIDSSWMLLAALAVVVGAEVSGAAIRIRALSPRAPLTDVVLRAAVDEARIIRRPARLTLSGGHDSGAPSPSVRSRRGRIVGSLVVGMAGFAGLIVSGHVPEPGMLIALLMVLVVGGVLLLPFAAVMRGDRQSASRPGRAVASDLFSDVSLAGALVVALAIVAHTGGVNAISFFEAASIAACTALAARIGPLPRGLITADLVFVIPLTWIGVLLEVALAAVLVWRLSSFLVVAVATALSRATSPVVTGRSRLRDRAQVLHRTVFRLIGCFPVRVAQRTRAAAFDTMFVRSNDPWAYATNAFEERKRHRLVEAVGTAPTFVLEVGCANGHNLLELARRLPEAIIAGSDVSPKAVTAARALAADFENVKVWHSDDVWAQAQDLGRPVDCIVLSEILYYLGSTSAMRSTLAVVSFIVRPGCRVVMLHGSSDAKKLHLNAMRALNLEEIEEFVVSDPERPYVVTVARFPNAC